MSICYEFALACKIKSNVSQEIVDTLNYMTRSQEYDFDPPKLDRALFRESSAWKQTVESLGRRFTVIRYEWRTILTNYPHEGERYLPGQFGSTFQDRQLKCRRLSREGEFNNVWWLLLPWLASISESTGFVGYYRGDFDNRLYLVQFSNGKASVCELIPVELVQAATIGLDGRGIVFNLNVDVLSEPVKQELLRQAESSKMSLEVYISSMVTKKYVDEDMLSGLEGC